MAVFFYGSKRSYFGITQRLRVNSLNPFRCSTCNFLQVVDFELGALFEKILTADSAFLFLDWICPKHCKSHDKSLKTGQLR